MFDNPASHMFDTPAMTQLGNVAMTPGCAPSDAPLSSCTEGPSGMPQCTLGGAQAYLAKAMVR